MIRFAAYFKSACNNVAVLLQSFVARRWGRDMAPVALLRCQRKGNHSYLHSIAINSSLRLNFRPGEACGFVAWRASPAWIAAPQKRAGGRWGGWRLPAKIYKVFFASFLFTKKKSLACLKIGVDASLRWHDFGFGG
jgi:hypothetical protein